MATAESLKPTVLLVDDEQDALDAISLLLGDEFRVLTATNGEDALALLRDEFVGAVLADQRMSGMNGVALLEEVREHYPRVARVLLTAYADYDVLVRACNDAQIHRYIPKPWTPEDMVTLLHAVIEEHGPPLCVRRVNKSDAAAPGPALDAAAPNEFLRYDEDDDTSELRYPQVHADITIDQYMREAANGHGRWFVLGGAGVLGGALFVVWAMYQLLHVFL